MASINAYNPVSSPDFVVDCSFDGELDSLVSREIVFNKTQLGPFFISVNNPSYVNVDRIAKGGTENMSVSGRCGIESLFDGELTLSNDSFILRKNVALKPGEAYVIEFVGHRVKGHKGYVGTYHAFDKKTGKLYPFFSGNFHTSPEHFFNKYNSTNESNKNLESDKNLS
jgi:hypothetical protein